MVLGEHGGCLEVVDINTSTITSTHRFTEAGHGICDIIAIDDAHFLLAANNGLLKTSKDQLIKHYYKGKTVTCLCNITDSLLLVGFSNDKLTFWNQKNE